MKSGYATILKIGLLIPLFFSSYCEFFQNEMLFRKIDAYNPVETIDKEIIFKEKWDDISSPFYFNKIAYNPNAGLNSYYVKGKEIYFLAGNKIFHYQKNQINELFNIFGNAEDYVGFYASGSEFVLIHKSNHVYCLDNTGKTYATYDLSEYGFDKETNRYNKTFDVNIVNDIILVAKGPFTDERYCLGKHNESSKCNNYNKYIIDNEYYVIELKNEHIALINKDRDMVGFIKYYKQVIGTNRLLIDIFPDMQFDMLGVYWVETYEDSIVLRFYPWTKTE